ncbi:family 16 glycosylhydrolase, partial [Thomasclavelia ramosa]
KEGNQSNKIVYGTPHFYYSKATSDGDKDGSYSPTELGGNKVLGENLADEYHVYGINWSPDKIEWYIDDVVYNTMYLDNDERLIAAAKAFQ